MTYNVQNLFDDVSQGSEYAAVNPAGGRWNSNLYHLKLCAVADVITCSNSLNPDIVLLQEVENINVIKELSETYLKGEGYSYLHISTEDYGAVHTAILSRYPISAVYSHRVWGTELKDQRFIMEYSIKVGEKEVLIFNNHWKSKSGSGNSDRERQAAAELLIYKAKNGAADNPYIVAAGDFNNELAKSPFFDSFAEAGAVLGELFYMKPANGDGSYVYKQEWLGIDLFLLSEAVVMEMEPEVVYNNSDYLLNSYGFPSKFNTDAASGYSDHLPVILTVLLN